MADNKMTPELRAKLLTRLPFGRGSSIEYTPKPYLTKVKDESGNATDEYEIPEDYRPIFIVRPFSVNEKNKMSKDEKVLRDITRANIIGFRQLYDIGSMEELTFKADPSGGMDKDQFELLPVTVMRDLFVYISGISGLSDYEKTGL